ncbi:class III lanthipeptide [Bacillus toyonensis]|nr:class III lanthipeptide [Bacillus toyonensis]MED3481735.1 class III lanthipeptide [Bacillus toyonensis]
MNKVLSLQKAAVSKDIQLKAASYGSVVCKGSSNASWFLC